jgi:hypothetical protein
MTDSLFGFLLVTAFAFIVGIAAGWLGAHAEVATECERQGSFYVGKKDFECKVKP